MLAEQSEPILIHSLNEFKEMFGDRVLLPQLNVGDTCYACERPVPKKRSDDARNPSRSVVSISEPRGSEGTIEALAVAVVDKYQKAWPREFAAMRAGLGLEVVGGRAWKFYVIEFALQAMLQIPGLEPVTGDE